MAGPEADVGLRIADLAFRIAGTEAGDESAGAGTHITAACLDEIPVGLPSGLFQRLPVPRGLAAVHIDHPETRRTVRIEENAVLVHRRAGDELPLPERVRRCEGVGCGGCMLGGDKRFH